MVFEIDTLILILQYMYHWQVIQEGKEESGQKGSLKLLSVLTGRVNRFKNIDEKTNTSEFGSRDYKVE